jgi:hypothetical protein
MSASPEPLALLERAAELRATGMPWDQTAAQLSLGRDELRRLTAEHRRDYDRLLRRERAELLRETLDAALTALRTQIHSSDSRLSYLASCTFVRYRLACLRHSPEEARNRLQRDTSPRAQKRMTADLARGPAPNTSESTKVQTQQDVIASKNVAQSTPQPAPSPAPQSTPGVTVTPPAAAPSAVKPASTASANSPISPEERERRRRLLLNNFAQGRDSATPPGKDTRLDREIQRLADRPSLDETGDDAPPG